MWRQPYWRRERYQTSTSVATSYGRIVFFRCQTRTVATTPAAALHA